MIMQCSLKLCSPDQIVPPITVHPVFPFKLISIDKQMLLNHLFEISFPLSYREKTRLRREHVALVSKINWESISQKTVCLCLCVCVCVFLSKWRSYNDQKCTLKKGTYFK